jgi:hypothetical protein
LHGLAAMSLEQVKYFLCSQHTFMKWQAARQPFDGNKNTACVFPLRIPEMELQWIGGGKERLIYTGWRISVEKVMVTSLNGYKRQHISSGGE